MKASQGSREMIWCQFNRTTCSKRNQYRLYIVIKPHTGPSDENICLENVFLFLSSSDIFYCNDAMKRASDVLKERYRNEMADFVICKLKTGDAEAFKRVTRNEFHVDLALVHSAEVDRDWFISDREYHLAANYDKDRQMLSYKDLLAVDDKYVILRGIAGVGKTSLIDYMLLQWANGCLWNNVQNMPSFAFVFKFPCRELNLYQNKVSIQGLFERLYPKVFRQISFEDLVTCRQRVLVILDGFDEFREQNELLESCGTSFSEETNIGAVLHNMLKPLTGCFLDQTTILASRPDSANTLYLRRGKKVKIKRVDIVGFTMEGISKYVRNFAITRPDLQQVILRKIAGSKTLKAMSHIPVYLWIICSLFEEDIAIPAPETDTELYIWAFGVFLREHLKASPDSIDSLASKPLNEIFHNEKCRDILNVLSHLSYNMMMEKKALFYETEINKLGISTNSFATEASGFIVYTKKNDVEGNVYQFRHLVLQEFFSACYLFKEAESLPTRVLEGSEFLGVISIVAGLQGAMIKNSKSTELVKSFAGSLKLRCGHLVICDIFSDEARFYCLISSLFEFANPLPEQARMAVADQLARHFIDFIVIHYHVLNCFLFFVNQMEFKRDATLKFKSIRIMNLELNDIQFSSLSAYVFCTQRLSLFFSPINGTEGFRVLFENVNDSWKEDKRKGTANLLKTLEIISCNLDDNQLILIAKVIPLIETVDLSGNSSLGVPGIKMLAEAIRNAKNEASKENRMIRLSTLILSNCNIKGEQLEFLAEAIPHVRTVDLSHNRSMSKAGLKVLVKEISNAERKERTALRKLDLSFCELRENSLVLLDDVCIPVEVQIVVEGGVRGTYFCN